MIREKGIAWEPHSIRWMFRKVNNRTVPADAQEVIPGASWVFIDYLTDDKRAHVTRYSVADFTLICGKPWREVTCTDWISIPKNMSGCLDGSILEKGHITVSPKQAEVYKELSRMDARSNDDLLRAIMLGYLVPCNDNDCNFTTEVDAKKKKFRIVRNGQMGMRSHENSYYLPVADLFPTYDEALTEAKARAAEEIRRRTDRLEMDWLCTVDDIVRKLPEEDWEACRDMLILLPHKPESFLRFFRGEVLYSYDIYGFGREWRVVYPIRKDGER